MVVDGNLTVSGSLNELGLTYKPWRVAGRFDGVNMVVLSSKGEYSCTTRPASYPIGIYAITWTQPHPDGANYVSCCSGEEGGWNDLVNGVGTGLPTPSSTTMSVAFRKLWQNGTANQAEGLAD